MKAAKAAPPLNDAVNAAMFGRVHHFASLGVRFCNDGSWTYTLRANDDETSKSLKFRLGGEGQSSWSCETKPRRWTPRLGLAEVDPERGTMDRRS